MTQNSRWAQNFCDKKKSYKWVVKNSLLARCSRTKVKNSEAVLKHFRKRFSRLSIIELRLSQAKGILRFYYRDYIFDQITFSNMCHHLRTTNPWEKWGGFIRRWLTFKEVATELQIPLKSIYGYHYKGIGPKVSKYGRHLRVLETDFIAWQEERAITGKL